MNDRPDDPDRHEESEELIDFELHFESMREIQDRLAPMLSSDGLFVATEQPLATDTVVRFAITLPEDFVLVSGTAVVIWNRGAQEDAPAGMALRYVSLSREAQETIDAIIDAHLAGGGELFDLDASDQRIQSIPTDALSGVSSTKAARDLDAVVKELELARLTIRDQPPREAEPPPSPSESQLEDDYLDAVEAQVDEAVAGIGRSVNEELAAQATSGGDDLGDMPELPFEASPEAESAWRRDEESSSSSAADGGDAGSRQGDEAREEESEEPPGGKADEELIESVIPVFLERWRKEIEGGEAGNGATRDEVVAEAEPEEALVREGEGEEILTGASDDEPIPSEEAEARRVALAAEGSGFDITGFGREEDEEPEPTSVRRSDSAEDEVTLVPDDRSRPSRLLLWGLPVVLAVAVAAVVVLGWDQLRRTLGLGPAVATQSDTQLESSRRAGDPTHGMVEEPVIEEPSGVPAVPMGAEAEDQDAAGVLPEPEPAVVAQEPEAPVPAAGPASRVDAITWLPGEGATEIIVEADGIVSSDAVSIFPMRDPPRILVRLRGIDKSYPTYQMVVGTPEVARIRIGHHPEQTPPALYVVLDLADPLVGVADYDVDGSTVRVRVAVQ